MTYRSYETGLELDVLMPSSLAEGVPHQLITQRNAETGGVTYKRKREFDAVLLFLNLGVKFGFYRNNVFAISQLRA